MYARLCFIVLCLLLGAACQGRQEDPRPTATSAQAIGQTAESTATVAPSPTILVPTATASPPPVQPTLASISVLPSATDTPSATFTPTAIPTPVKLSSWTDFGDNRNIFTGELVTDTSVLARRPLLVKISNWPGDEVRPQSGPGQADIVYEHIAEGVTRFSAIIYSQTPERLGSIRSARLIDLELPAMYDTALVYSGASDGVNTRLARVDFRERKLMSMSDGYYRTGEDKPYEHTFFADPVKLWQTLEERDLNQPPRPSNIMPFDETPPPGGETGTQLDIAYRMIDVGWRYEPDGGRYLRWSDNEPHRDANTGQQISAANVVVVFAWHELITSICEHLADGVCSAYSTEIRLWDEGDAILLRDGQAYDARWRRHGRNDMLVLLDSEGELLPYQLGPTWFQIVPLTYTDRVTVAP